MVYNVITTASKRGCHNNDWSQPIVVNDLYTDMSARQFNLIITEGSPECKGHETAKKYIAAGNMISY